MVAGPVTAWRKAEAAKTLENVPDAATACRDAGIPFFVACALLEQESGGKNIFGHDVGGSFSGGGIVTPLKFLQFYTEAMNGKTSNGVGPCQITYAGAYKSGHRDGGYFRLMINQGLLPYEPLHNMLFGFRILAGNYEKTGSWEKAGAIYNGGPNPGPKAIQYGKDFSAKIAVWKQRLKI